MSRALVLGGGGPLGIAWQAGLAVGLAERGVDLATADLVVGTSAGSVVGALLALGEDLERILSLMPGGTGTPPPVDSSALVSLVGQVAAAAASGEPPEVSRRAMGHLAATAATIPEADYLALFAPVEGATWPETLRCTAVEIETGALKVWDAAASVSLAAAVASSCSVPGVFPPVTIEDRRYMDGGTRSLLNADLAAGHDSVLAVSCFLLQLPPGLSDPTLDALAARIDAELDTVRAEGKLEVIVPGAEFLEVSGWGLNVMDFARTADAYGAGLRQAVDEADRIATLWA